MENIQKNNNNPVYIALDVETGGLDSSTSLLTAYLAILDENLETVSDLYLNLKPNDGIYIVTGRGMAVNGINIAEHDKIAITYKDASKLVYNLLNDNRATRHLQPIGQNVKFDINRVCADLINPSTWDQFVSYRTLDIASIAGFLIDVGILPDTITAGLKSMVEYFGVGKQEDFGHDAKHDTELSIAVYKELKKLFPEDHYVKNKI